MTPNNNTDGAEYLTDQPESGGSGTYTDGFGRTSPTLVTDGGEDDTEEWRPSCYDCGREMRRRHLNPTPVHIEHEDGSGYDVVDVPLCHSCRVERLPTHACQVCGQEYIHLDRAAECCQHRQERPVPDGGEVAVTTDTPLDVATLPAPVCEHCGEPITDGARDCPAVAEGWCRP